MLDDRCALGNILHQCQDTKEYHHVSPESENVPRQHLDHLAAPKCEHERGTKRSRRTRSQASFMHGAKHSSTQPEESSQTDNSGFKHQTKKAIVGNQVPAKQVSIG